ncbi:MAG: Fe-S protein assembly co-chaperone HscB [Candidatus Dasytiphilus stammeri]
MNYFELFQLPVNFKIDYKLLTTHFYDLQRQFHPDRYINFSHKNKIYYLQQSALINKAWQVLRYPLSRAEYVLTLYGVNKEYGTIKDQKFLSQQMNLREEYEELKKTMDIKKINKFTSSINRIIKKLHQNMEFTMENQQWKIAVTIIQKIHFYNRIRSNIEELENFEL